MNKISVKVLCMRKLNAVACIQIEALDAMIALTWLHLAHVYAINSLHHVQL